MKQITLSLFALSLAAAPLSAQQETPMQMAQRLDACNGAEILSASVDAAGELEVSCATAVAGNGGASLTVPALGLAALGLAVGAFAGGSSSSDTQ